MKIGIGAVQFGLDYGISNQAGKTPVQEVNNILQIAQKAEIEVIDTAPAYGDSESVLGHTLTSQHLFRIITKTPIFHKKKIVYDDAKILKNTFCCSLKKLNQSKIAGLLIHNADDLLLEGGKLLFDTMQTIKQEGGVQKIGVSVYIQEQIKKVLEMYDIDLIQLPVNLLDQRLIQSGYLKELKKRNIEIHARSVFLQGILLMPPESLHPFFDPIKPLLNSYREFLQNRGLTPLEGALGFIKEVTEIDVVILGINHAKQLRQNLSCFNKTYNLSLDEFTPFSLSANKYLNPSLWELD